MSSTRDQGRPESDLPVPASPEPDLPKGPTAPRRPVAAVIPTAQVSFDEDRFFRRLCLALVAGCVSVAAGCSSLNTGVFTHPGSPSRLKPIGPGVHLDAASSTQVYQKVCEAAAQNSIVLEVVGVEEPIRLLPLPPDNRSVFVSDLLNDTGVLAKLGQVKATLYRHSTASLGGVPMDVKMTSGLDEVRPESDYALHAGDRLQVRKAEFRPFSRLFEAAMVP